MKKYQLTKNRGVWGCSLFLVLWLLPWALYAQSNGKIMVRGTYHQGKVLLRWVPKDFSVWLQGNTYGYRVVRQLASVNGVAVSSSERIASSKTFWGPYKALSEAAWVPLSDTSDVAAVAAGAIYSEDFQVVPGGGSDQLAQAVSTNEKNQNRFGFGLFAADQSFSVAQAMGLALADQDAAQNSAAAYTYRVILLTPDSLNRPFGLTVVNLQKPLLLPAPDSLKVATTPGNATLYLPRGELETYYTSFNIERSDDDGATFTRRNNKPLVFISDNEFSTLMVFSDTLEEVGKVYRYRMCGKSPFGVQGPPSNIAVAVNPRKPLDVSPNIINITEQDGKFVIDWDFPSQYNTDIERFEVLRSGDSEGGFVLLPGGATGVDIRQYTDQTPDLRSNYYKVIAIQKGNYKLESNSKLAQLNDTQPPAVPTGLSATVDNKGLVVLQWTANTEQDLQGYRVYWSNHPEEDFVPSIGTIIEGTTFKHQLNINVLNKRIYFKVSATDLRENESDYSPSIGVSRPDAVPPAKPVLSKAEPQPDGVKLEWIFSKSEDVARHELQRREAAVPIWETLSVYPSGSGVTTATDSTAKGTLDYSYRILAYDSAGLVSSSGIIVVKPLKNNLDPITNFKVTSALDGSQKQAKLSWEYPMAEQLREFQVYRAMENGAPHLYCTVRIIPDEVVLDPNTKRAGFFYRDTDIIKDKKYYYQVLAKYQDGSSSALTASVQFQY